MSNNRIQTPVGLPNVVDKVQKQLYVGLSGQTEPIVKAGAWGAAKLDGYPICEALERGDGPTKTRTIEYYKGPDYKELIHAEGNKFFFTAEAPEAPEKDFDHWKTEVELFFIVNLKQVKGDISGRAAEAARLDVIKILNTIGDIKIKSVVKKFDEVFKGYTYNYTDNMQPYHYFRITLTIYPYRIDQKNCN